MDAQRTVKVIEDSKGRKLLVEVSREADISGPVGAGEDQDLYEAVGAKEQFAKFTNTLSGLISDTAGAILDGLNAISQPSKVQVEFGVELGAEGEVWFIAKGSVSSTIKVSIEWESLKSE